MTTHDTAPSPTGAPVPANAPVRTGLVFDIQRFSLYDGPGIRTTVFLKGCPLHCPWCHNPESIAPRRELLFNAAQCVHCGACVAVCATGAHHVTPAGEPTGTPPRVPAGTPPKVPTGTPAKATTGTPARVPTGAPARATTDAPATVPTGTPVGGHLLNRDACIICGACAQVCPSRALEICGQERTVDDVMAVVLRDRGYYADSGGGLTLSGGEPLMQPAFALKLLTAAKAAGLHTAVETSGCAAWHHFEALHPVTDLFLFDIKETDPARHAAVIGVLLKPIQDNLRRLSSTGARIVLRLPFIPGYNDRPDHIEAVVRLARGLPTLAGVDLLPYHRLGKGKRVLLGHDDTEVSHPPEPAQVQTWKTHFASAGLQVRLPEEQ